MNGWMNRNCFDPGGFVYESRKAKGLDCAPLPRHVAGVRLGTGRYGQDQEQVTWEEISQIRRERQARHSDFLRKPAEPDVLPCYVWTFFNRQSIPYHGWYCYVVTRAFDMAVNFRHFHTELAVSIMAALPLGVLPLPENFELWMAALAKHSPRRPRADPRKAGVMVGWLSQRRRFTLDRVRW